MNTDAIVSSFSRLPGFSPLSFVNISGQCATTRLMQCEYLGIDMNDVSRKFDHDPDDIDRYGDLGTEEFIARRAVHRAIQKWNARSARKGGDRWTPILYGYEIVSNSAKHEQDWGHMLFVDSTLTQFLVVLIFGPPTCDCGNAYHNDYAALTKMQAQRILCLAKYVYFKETSPKVKWVHATYTTWAQPLNANVFLADTSSANLSASPPIIHVSTDALPGSLAPSELEKIDNVLKQHNSRQMPPKSLREDVTRNVSTAKALAANGGEGVFTAGRVQTKKECASCRKLAVKMHICSNCKLVVYCNRECQQKHWKYHKKVCKRAEARPQAARPAQASRQRADSLVSDVVSESTSVQPAPPRAPSPALAMPGAFPDA